MSELELIDAIQRSLRGASGRLLRGPGDDAAVVAADPIAVTSIDSVVEGVHFNLSTHSHADVGHRGLAAGLSDLAAMGAAPGEAYVAMVVPATTDTDAAVALVSAMEALAERTGVQLAGGDVSGGPTLTVSVAVTGWAAAASELLYRSGASPGDLLGVSGELGGSGAGLLLLAGTNAAVRNDTRDALTLRHRRPEPRLALGRVLAAAGASAAIDLSDGVASDAGHLARASGVAINVRLGDLPLDAGVASVAESAGREPAELAATSGEDFELLLTAPTQRRESIERVAASAGSSVTWIGEVREGRGLRLLRADGTEAQLSGYEHLE